MDEQIKIQMVKWQNPLLQLPPFFFLWNSLDVNELSYFLLFPKHDILIKNFQNLDFLSLHLKITVMSL